MTPEEFANEFRLLKEQLVEAYFSQNSEASKIRRLEDAGLNEEQIEAVRTLTDEALSDALYTVLLGLDGCASIGNHQITYAVMDENKNILSGEGELETEAWEAFHGENT